MPEVEHSKESFLPSPVKIKDNKLAKFVFTPVFALIFAGLFCVSFAHPSFASVTYRVRKGDTLDKIARRYRISVKKLKKENGLSSNRLKPGRRLRIIAEAGRRRHKKEKAPRSHLFAKKHFQHIRHTKKSLRHYARRRYSHEADGREKKIRIAADDSASNKVTASPHGEVKDSFSFPNATSEKEKAEKGENASGSVAPVKIASSMESASNISKIQGSALINATSGAIFNSILEKAARYNREARLSAASRQRLVVYKDRYHKVRKGETLFSIARQYGTTIKKLRELNGLRSRRARLRSGRRLLISQKDAVMREAPGTYRVKKGDTFLKIARKFHRDAEELMALNEMDSEDLRPGQTIMLTDKDESPAVQADARVSAPQIESKLEELQDSKTLQTLSMKDRLMLFAKVMLNIPYRFGGDNFYGIDCSAFVQRVFKLLNISLPRTARQQFNEGVPVSLDDLAIGDLVFFRTYASFPSHVGIYIGKNLFIHASSGGHRVKIGSLTTPYFMKRLIGAKRLLSGGELPITGSGK